MGFKVTYYTSMRIDQELVARKLCESRQEAQESIENGYVYLDGIIVLKKTRQVSESSVITVTGRRKFVSRGGDKLEGILLDIYKDENTIKGKLANKSALDIGSSTGGFTDCLLSYGVQHVTAVDVGTGQTHPKLLDNRSVAIVEKTDIRNFRPSATFDIIVADLSFISLEKVIETIFTFGANGSLFFLLIKPQFEVGFGNTKKGIVKDIVLTKEVLIKYKYFFKAKKVLDLQICPCRIEGSDGNQEYFVYFRV